MTDTTGGEHEELATYEVTIDVTLSLTMKAPKDIATEDLWDMAETEYSEGADSVLEGHVITGVARVDTRANPASFGGSDAD